MRIAAVDTESGELRIFSDDGSTPLEDAVAASCAVPGVWPPVTIGGARYMDGGVRSLTNADLAAGAARIVVLAPFGVGFGAIPSLAKQVDALRRAGSRVAVVSPNWASRRAFGRNNLDPARRAPAARAGYAQAEEALAEVRATWEGPLE